MKEDKAHLLLVDDDEDLRRLMTLRLTAAGYQVTAVDSGERALATLSVTPPQVVITDMCMPGGMDGSALFDAIHREYPTLPVIILTAHGTIPDAVAATRRGIFGYLTKPYDPPELLAELERALRISQGKTGIADDDWRVAIITANPAMEALLGQARLLAGGDASILIRGPSGSGKEVLAKAIHQASPRRKQPFLAVNCGAIPEQLLESELFGHLRGAFTGAVRDHAGLFQEARGGTVFLDEIGDMPLPLQVKLLRVLEERQVRPVGSARSLAIDVRIISATHQPLETAITEQRFREDLYYRLNVAPLILPPLAERRDDIPLLAQHFLKQLSSRYGKTIGGFAPEAIELLIDAPWPGNIRQLYNVIEQSVALSVAPVIPASLIENALHDRQRIGS